MSANQAGREGKTELPTGQADCEHATMRMDRISLPPGRAAAETRPPHDDQQQGAERFEHHPQVIGRG